MEAILRDDITGLVLAGGLGSRMGGVDKGLQLHAGRPLALHALQRLASQVGPLAVNANRNLDRYAAFGVPVWPDATADRPGPLAGLLAGLQHCATPWLLSVPCDSPNFPADLATRLAAAAVQAGAELAIAEAPEADGRLRPQPVFCLLRRELAAPLQAFLSGGQRRVEHFADQRRAARARFDDAAAFANANTADDLRRLQPES
ncbi:MAG: molybdenum cofactor guanylyltransferase MobA [Proteobacteria bacterium]|nr:molybdenum cofactor guanylyltransferase MobA [Pseudomonadota bacterium]